MPRRRYPSVDVAAALQLPLTFSGEVSEQWLDVMGHMNVAWYTHVFSQATRAFRSSVGLTDEQVTEEHRGSFALETHTRYLAELRLGEHFEIRTRALGRSATRFHLLHLLIVPATQQVATSFELVAGHVDTQLRSMIPIPPAMAEAIDAWVATHSRLIWEPPLTSIMSI